MDHLIQIHNLGKRHDPFGGWVFRDVDFSLPRGEVFGLTGENGSGKTTLLRIILGLDIPTRGKVSMSGQVRAGYVPEKPAFYHHFKVGEQLCLMGGIAGLSRKKLRKRITEVLEISNLGAKAGARIGSLSPGMLRRLGIALAIIDDPDLLLLDETAEGSDILTREEINNLVLFLNRLGKTVLLSSCSYGDLEAVCHRVGMLHRGKMVLDPAMQKLILDRRESISIRTDSSEEILKEILGDTAPEGAVQGGTISFRHIDDGAYFTLMGRLIKHRIRIKELTAGDGRQREGEPFHACGKDTGDGEGSV